MQENSPLHKMIDSLNREFKPLDSREQITLPKGVYEKTDSGRGIDGLRRAFDRQGAFL